MNALRNSDKGFEKLRQTAALLCFILLVVLVSGAQSRGKNTDVIGSFKSVPDVPNSEKNDSLAPPDSEDAALARRRYAASLERTLVRVLAKNPNIDPTLVSLRVYTSTPQSPRGLITRKDYRLHLETNTVALPRDVTSLLRNSMLNRGLFNAGFKEVSFQNSIGEKLGTVLCRVELRPQGAHPTVCMQMKSEDGYDMNWDDYHYWPKDYIVRSQP